jgi:hypothetical protein
MRLVPYDKKLVGSYYKRTKNYDILLEFVNSKHDCVRVEGWTHKKARYCATSLQMSIKRFNMGGVECFVRNGEVYLIKTT